MLMGPVLRSKPNDTASFLAALSAQIKTIGQHASADRVKQLLGVMYTDLPISLGGTNPWNFVPTCLTRAADHLFHDEVGLHHEHLRYVLHVPLQRSPVARVNLSLVGEEPACCRAPI